MKGSNAIMRSFLLGLTRIMVQFLYELFSCQPKTPEVYMSIRASAYESLRVLESEWNGD